MIASPDNVKWRRFSFSLSLIAVVALGASSDPRAQDQRGVRMPPALPQRLTPPPQGTSPPPAEPSPAQAPPVQAAPAPPSALTGPGVQVDSLKAIDPDSAGTLGDGQGGFGSAMWDGMPRADVAMLLPRLPVSTTSAAMRDLMRRLLLSTAVPPAGQGPSGEFVGLRTDLLVAMGDMVAATALLNATPDRTAHERLARAEIDLRFLANDNHRACSAAAGRMRDQPSTYWQKALVFCQALAGEHAKAALGLSVLRELGENDLVFSGLISALASGTVPTVTSLPDATPIHLAAARAAKAQLPSDVTASGKPAVLRTVAASPNVAMEVRLKAGEAAEAVGALPAEALRQLYISMSFSEKDLASPLSRADTLGGSMARALLFRSATMQSVAAAQAEAVAKALSISRGDNHHPTAARVFLPVLKKIQASPELMWFAPEAIRAFLVAGDIEAAQTWMRFLRTSAVLNEESGQAASDLVPLMRLAAGGDGDQWAPKDVEAWWHRVKGRENARARAVLVFTLFDLIDDPVPPDAWAVLTDGFERRPVSMPDPVILHRLGAASKAARVGETVLMALLVLGGDGPDRANPIVLDLVLSALKTIGLKAEARALAVEAALAAGL